MKKKILIHACCAPCTAGVWTQLKNDFEVTLFWYNPNIFPKDEHDRRLMELLNFCDSENIKIIVGDYDWHSEHKCWLKMIKGWEKEPERGKRCDLCYRMRIEATVSVAAQINNHHPEEFDLFAAELSISPHKDAKMINEIGELAGKKFNIPFYFADFKKNDGYKRGCEISSKNNMYRQSYCGCEFSKSNR